MLGMGMAGVINGTKIAAEPRADGEAAAAAAAAVDKGRIEDNHIKEIMPIDIAMREVGILLQLRVRVRVRFWLPEIRETRNKMEEVEMTLPQGQTGPLDLVNGGVKKIECRNGVDEGLS